MTYNNNQITESGLYKSRIYQTGQTSISSQISNTCNAAVQISDSALQAASGIASNVSETALKVNQTINSTYDDISKACDASKELTKAAILEISAEGKAMYEAMSNIGTGTKNILNTAQSSIYNIGSNTAKIAGAAATTYSNISSTLKNPAIGAVNKIFTSGAYIAAGTKSIVKSGKEIYNTAENAYKDISDNISSIKFNYENMKVSASNISEMIYDYSEKLLGNISYMSTSIFKGINEIKDSVLSSADNITNTYESCKNDISNVIESYRADNYSSNYTALA